MAEVAHQAPDGELAVVFLEGGKLQVARQITAGDKRVRVRDSAGRVRKIERAKALATLPAAAAATVAAAITALADGLDMAQAWAQAAGEILDTATLARRCFPAATTAHREAALVLAHARDGGFFRCRNEAWTPVPAQQHARVLASRAARAQAAALEQAWLAELAAGRLPDELAAYLDAFMAGEVKPDSHCHRFLHKRSGAEGMGIAALAVKWGRVTDFEEFHTRDIRRKLPPAVPDPGPPAIPAGLAQAAAGALTFDASGTVEIDDAFSIGAGSQTLGVHIAAPGLGMLPAAREQAMARMATLYLPGAKHMMLPEATVAAYSLAAGTSRPCVSLELEWDAAAGKLARHRFTVGQVSIAANHDIERCTGMRHPDLDPAGQALLGRLQAMVDGVIPARDRHPGGGQLVTLVGKAPHLIDRNAFKDVDRIVAGVMVLYNREAARFLGKREVPYLSRRAGHVRVATADNRPPYGWFTSPLRRLADLVNQEQLLAAVNGTPAPHDAATLGEIASAFNRQHSWLVQLQQRLELYWSLRWLEGRMDVVYPGHTTKEPGRVRLADAPVTVAVPPDGRPEGQQVSVKLDRLDPYSLQAWGTLA